MSIMAKVDVPMTWLDFFWSLEKLSHMPYSKQGQERDWFRINPLETVLLGCKCLGVHQSCDGQVATVTIGMVDITEEMASRVRLWLKVISVLTGAFTSENCPTGVLQKVLIAIKHVYDAAKRLDRVYVPVVVQLALYVYPKLKAVSQESVVILSSARSSVSELVAEFDSMLHDCSLHFAPRPSARQPLILRLQDLPSSREQQQDVKDAQLHIFLYARRHGFDSISTYLQHLDSAHNLMAVFEVCESSCIRPLQCLSWILDCIESQPRIEDGDSNDISELLSQFVVCCQKWLSVIGSKSDVPNKIIELCVVLITAHQGNAGLQLAISLLRNPFDVLISYSTEGYLSSRSAEFLTALLELLAVGVETGTNPMETMTFLLPNLFGPLFGARDHRVSRALLDYGVLSLCSSHRKTLLEKGLHFIGKLYRLFPPLDAVIAQRQAACLRAEATSVVSDILANVLDAAVSARLTSISAGSKDVEKVAKQLVWNVIHKAFDLVEDDQHVELTLSSASDISEEITVPSDSDHDEDRLMRMNVTVELLHLACAIIRKGDDVCFLFGNILPKLFQAQQGNVPSLTSKQKLTKFFGEDPSRPGVTSWTDSHKSFALEVLKLTTGCVQKNVCSPFLISAVAVPKLRLEMENEVSKSCILDKKVTNIDQLQLTNSEKLNLTMEVLHIARDGLMAGQDIQDFVEHGIDFLSNLIPQTGTSEQLKCFVADMTHCFIRPSQSSVLFLAKSSCQFMLQHFPDEKQSIQALFRILVQKGRRDDIRSVFRVCKEPLVDECYTMIRPFIYDYSTGDLNSRQLQALCEHLQLMFGLTGVHGKQRQMSDEEQNQTLFDEQRSQSVLKAITDDLLKEMVFHLQHRSFNRDVWEKVNERLARVALFKTLYSHELAGLVDQTAQNVLGIFDSKFPPDVISSQDLMTTLSQCATRLENLQLPRYEALKQLLIQILNYFLGCDVTEVQNKEKENEDMETVRQKRVESLETYLLDILRNVEDRNLLVSRGYSIRCWQQPCRITVKTNGRRSLEENMRQALLACYREYGELLKGLGIAQALVDGENIAVNQLFDETFQLSDLKGRRAVAVRLIDHRSSSALSSRALDRKTALLAEEDRIESEFESQSLAPVQPKTFVAVLHTSFFDCARCCGPKLIGCYAPTGEHCERPMEIGMRQDSGFISIYDEKGDEIENSELLLADEGVYVYKTYTNGHPFDTGEVWVSMFEALLKGPDSYVPAIIVPMHHPNQQAWHMIRRAVDTEMTGSELTCRPDFSPTWKTYYDYRPERIQCGRDVVLHPGFAVDRGGRERRALMRQKSVLTKDLSGEMFDCVIQEMLKDDWLKRFRFLGKYIAQFVSHFVNEGLVNNAILLNGFDYDRWKKSQRSGKVLSKLEIVEQLSSYVTREVVNYCVQVDVSQLFATKQKHFFEMKNFVAKQLGELSIVALQRTYSEMLTILRDSTRVMSIHDLPSALREELMHYVFRNEDRVWRYRGGRDGYETLQQYMGFLGRTVDNSSDERSVVTKPRAFAGMAVFCSSREGNQNYKVEDVVAYAVGEHVPLNDEDNEFQNHFAYEVVTAWVHPRFRGLSLSVQMYCAIMERSESSFLLCDTLVGSLEHIVANNRLFQLLARLRLLSYLVRKREQSYEVITQDGHREKFERLMIYTTPLVATLKMAHWLSHYKRILMAAAPIIATGAWIWHRYWH